MWRAFVDRVRDNLHLVLALSPVGEAFRERCRRFPSLLAATSVDWFSEWPQVRGPGWVGIGCGKVCARITGRARYSWKVG